MRNFVYALTAAAAIAGGIPTLANAADVYIQSDRGYGYYGDRYDGPRFRLHERDREFRRGFYHRGYDDRDFVIREHRDYY